MGSEATDGGRPSAANVSPVLGILTVDNNDLYRILYLVHLLTAIAAFGPLFVYTRLRRAGDTVAIAKLHTYFVMPALVIMWVAGMGMAGVGKISLAGTPFVTSTIILWLIAMVVSFFLIRPALVDTDEAATSKLAMGVGITHLILIVALYLMIFKPGGYEFN